VIRGRRYRAVVGTPTYMTFLRVRASQGLESKAWNAQRDAVPVSTTMRTT